MWTVFEKLQPHLWWAEMLRVLQPVHITPVSTIAASGLVLVAVLFVLNLTVTEGSINGLIFFANVVSMSHFGQYSGTSSRLYTFIAWLNLDLTDSDYHLHFHHLEVPQWGSPLCVAVRCQHSLPERQAHLSLCCSPNSALHIWAGIFPKLAGLFRMQSLQVGE